MNGATACLGQPLCFRKIRFAAPEVLLRPFALFDIDICAVPFDDSSIFVEAWSCAEQKPTVFAIETAQPCLEFTWLTRSHNPLPVIHESIEVLRMKCSGPAGSLRLICREPRVVQPAPIEEFRVPVCR